MLKSFVYIDTLHCCAVYDEGWRWRSYMYMYVWTTIILLLKKKLCCVSWEIKECKCCCNWIFFWKLKYNCVLRAHLVNVLNFFGLFCILFYIHWTTSFWFNQISSFLSSIRPIFKIIFFFKFCKFLSFWPSLNGPYLPVGILFVVLSPEKHQITREMQELFL